MAGKKKNSSSEVVRKMWTHPWRYRESFLVAFLLMFAGVLIEMFTASPGISVPGFPANMFAGMTFIATLAFLHIFYGKSNFVKWLSGVPAAISSITLFSFAALILGLLPQNGESGSLLSAAGFTHVKNSWVIVMAQIYLLTSLGLVSLRRSTPLNTKNAGFLLNHAGLWIVIAGASLGTGDLQRLKMDLHAGETIWYAYDNQKRNYELPFAVRLDSFHIDQYPPKAGIFDGRTGRIAEGISGGLPHIYEGDMFTLLDYRITVEEFLPSAWPAGDGFTKSDETGSPPAARVTVTSQNGRESHTGWLSCGSFLVNPSYIILDNGMVLAMTEPRPERYRSDVRIYTKEKEPRDEVIEVNAPPRVEGWRLYQYSYDTSRGRWSELSVLEIVRDPWLPVVYTGIMMLLAGALYILWLGRGIKKEEPDDNNMNRPLSGRGFED